MLTVIPNDPGIGLRHLMSENTLQLKEYQRGVSLRLLVTALGLAGFTGEFANLGKNPTAHGHRDIATA
jgi:hypothetical protein